MWQRQKDGATAGEIGAYLRDYDKSVKPELVGDVPSREFVEDVVQKTNDSCAGPDGIPFACYRFDAAGGGHVTELLHRVLTALCEGVRGPAAFNKARLFLIAKT
jgi:hypothetical protein